jgi:aminoglycoside phosphotransferase (APT) family kinase protein
MQTLAGVHAIERNRVLAAGRPEARELPVYREFDAFEEEAEAVALELGEAGVAPSADEVARIASFLRARLRARVAAMRSYRPALPLVLLHADFQPANLVRSPDGRLLVVDLEGASFGAFAFDLARTLFKFRFRVKDAELDALRVAQVLGDRGIAGLCGDYFEAAGAASARFWSQHGATVLFYGYLKMIRRRAKFAQNPRRGGWLRRRRSAAQAAQRWASALAWVDGAS